MPGKTCAFHSSFSSSNIFCGISRKDKGISLFKVPTPNKTSGKSIKYTKDLMILF